MIKIVRVVRVDKPLESVAAYLQDFCTTNEWDPGTVKTELLEGDGGVGSRYRNVSKFAGRENELLYVVEELRESERISLRGENKTVRSLDTMQFARVDGQTEVTYTAEFRFQGAIRFVEPLLKPFFNRLGDNAAMGMRQRLQKLHLPGVSNS